MKICAFLPFFACIAISSALRVHSEEHPIFKKITHWQTAGEPNNVTCSQSFGAEAVKVIGACGAKVLTLISGTTTLLTDTSGMVENICNQECLSSINAAATVLQATCPPENENYGVGQVANGVTAMLCLQVDGKNCLIEQLAQVSAKDSNITSLTNVFNDQNLEVCSTCYNEQVKLNKEYPGLTNFYVEPNMTFSDALGGVDCTKAPGNFGSMLSAALGLPIILMTGLVFL